MNNVKTYLKGFLFLNILIVLLLCVNSIPKDKISNHLQETVEQYKEHNERYRVVNNLPQSMEDIVTDCIVFNIIANTDPEHVFDSTIESNYFCSYLDYYNEDLRMTVEDKEEPNENYARYWHGYNIVYRMLLLFFNVNGIKICMAGAFIFLIGVLAYLCVKNKMMKFFALYILSFLLGTGYFAFFTIGHLAPVFISLIGSMYIIHSKKINTDLTFLFLGIAVAFFDFLSVETLTLTIPLIAFIMKKKPGEVSIKQFVMANANWIIGYAFTFLYKWIISFIVSGPDAIVTTMEKGVDKVVGENRLTTGLSLNINMLFPGMNRNKDTFILFMVIMIILFIVIFLLHNKNRKRDLCYLGFIFLIPYIRFLVLANHGVIHYFFTYRAQISSIFCILLILTSCMDWKLVKSKL